MAYQFKVCEFKTGRVLDSAPFTVVSDLTRMLQGYGSGTLGLPIFEEGCPVNWEQLILPGRTLLIAEDEARNIVWNGVPQDRRRKGTGVVEYPSTTVEGYFRDRYTPSMAFVRADQADIARALAAVAGDAAGIPLHYDCPPTGVLRDITYLDDENTPIYTNLQELAAMENGFNWTIDVDWTDDTRTQVKYTFRTGYPHLGHRTPTPEHVFEVGGNIVAPSYEEQWGSGRGATMVQASSDGDGESKTASAPVIDTVREAAGWPRVERREQLSGILDQRTVDSHALGLAELVFGGQNVLSFTVKDGVGTSLRDLTLGDSAKVKSGTPELTLEQVLSVVGWAIPSSLSEFKPMLAKLGGGGIGE